MGLRVFGGEGLRKLLTDTLVVLIGVLAALVLNNVREDVIAERAARDATERLIQEVEQNAQELRTVREVVERRQSRLRELNEKRPVDKSLRDLALQFGGYWTVDLNSSAWDYLSRSALADSVDPILLQEAFKLYSHRKNFERLNGQIQDLIYSESFVSPEKAQVAIDISGAIMWQQLKWVDELLPEYEKFLSRHSSKTTGQEGSDNASR